MSRFGSWEVHVSNAGVPFFYNVDTAESVWHVPPDLAALLPRSSHWEECRGPDNAPYYFDTLTQESTWSLPAELLTAVPLRSEFADHESPARAAFFAAVRPAAAVIVEQLPPIATPSSSTSARKALPPAPVAAAAAAAAAATASVPIEEARGGYTIRGGGGSLKRTARAAPTTEQPPARPNYFSLSGVAAAPIVYDGSEANDPMARAALATVAIAPHEPDASAAGPRMRATPMPVMRQLDGSKPNFKPGMSRPREAGAPPKPAMKKAPPVDGRRPQQRAGSSAPQVAAATPSTKPRSSSTTVAAAAVTTTTTPYDAMTMKQLLEVIRERSLTERAEEAETKAELIAILVEADSGVAAPPKPDYQAMKMADLLKLARERGIDEADDAETRVEVALMLEADDEAREAVRAESTQPAPAAPADEEVEVVKRKTLAQVRQGVATRATDTMKRMKRNENLRNSFGKSSGLTLTQADVLAIQAAMTDEEIRKSTVAGASGETALVWTEIEAEADAAADAADARTSSQQRGSLVEALLARERQYVEALRTLDKVFLSPLVKAARADRKLRTVLGAVDPRRALLQLHGAVQLLHERHSMLAEQIDDCARDGVSTGDARIGTLFRDVTELLLVYGAFVAQEGDASAALQESFRANNDVARHVASAQADGAATLLALLRLPLEHVRGYMPFLRDILNTTARSHADFPDLVDAIELCQREVDDVSDNHAAAVEALRELRKPVAAASAARSPPAAAPVAAAAPAMASKLAARGGVQINVSQTIRQAAAEVLGIDVMREDVLRRHACSFRDTVGEAILTEARVAFVGVSGREAGVVHTAMFRDSSASPRIGADGALEVACGATVLKLGRFKSPDVRDDLLEQLLYVAECSAAGVPVLYHFAIEGKLLDTGEDGSRRDLVPCLLRVTTVAVEVRFSNGQRPRSHQLRHVRTWGHKGVRLSLVLGDSVDHLRVATKNERDAADVVQFLAFITRRIASRLQQQQQ
jgi:hypothetical protein